MPCRSPMKLLRRREPYQTIRQRTHLRNPALLPLAETLRLFLKKQSSRSAQRPPQEKNSRAHRRAGNESRRQESSLTAVCKNETTQSSTQPRSRLTFYRWSSVRTEVFIFLRCKTVR